MFGHEEDDLDIRPVPTVAEVVGEETPRVVIVLIWEQNAYTLAIDGSSIVVVSPDDAQEERTG